MDNRKFDIASFKRAQQEMIAKSDQYWDSSYSYHRHSTRLKDYSLEEVDEIINSNSVEELRKLSRNYFAKDGLYKRILIHYGTMMKYDGLLIPNPGFGKKLSTTHISKKYHNALDYLETLFLQELFTKISIKALVDGSYYGVIQKLDKKELILLDLPAEYCRSRFKDLYGRDVIEFNVLYFNSILDEKIKKEVLALYPKEVSSHYNKYSKGKTSTTWVKIPTEIGVYFSFFEDEMPLLVSIIPATIQYDEAVDTERERDLEEIRKIIVQKIPHLADGTLLFEPDEVKEMHAGAVGMVGKKNKNVSILTTYGDVDSIVSKTTSDAVSNNLEKMHQHVYAEANTSAQLFSPTGSQALDASVTNDMAMMMILVNKYSHFITDLINHLFGNTNISFKYNFLPISYYNQSDFIDESLKLAQSGYSFLMPSIALGLNQKELLSIKELENEVLNLQDKLIPLSSSYTQSSNDEGGRPPMKTEDKQQTTIEQQDSTDKNGGSKQ